MKTYGILPLSLIRNEAKMWRKLALIKYTCLSSTTVLNLGGDKVDRCSKTTIKLATDLFIDSSRRIVDAYNVSYSDREGFLKVLREHIRELRSAYVSARAGIGIKLVNKFVDNQSSTKRTIEKLTDFAIKKSTKILMAAHYGEDDNDFPIDNQTIPAQET